MQVDVKLFVCLFLFWSSLFLETCHICARICRGYGFDCRIQMRIQVSLASLLVVGSSVTHCMLSLSVFLPTHTKKEEKVQVYYGEKINV